MKRFQALALALLAGAVAVRGQVSVSVELDQKQYLVREAITASVRIVNFSGQTLQMGRTQDWLTFDVEAADGSYLEKLGDAPVVHEFEVPNAARATRRVDIAPYFKLVRLGRYKVIATVRVPELGQEIISSPAYLNIINGATLWKQPFGWRPDEEGKPGALQIRNYSLVQAMNGEEICLYGRVTDEDDIQVFRILCLGRLLTFSKPDAHLDRDSRLHVLWQTGAQTFTYTKLDPRGELILRQTYQYTSSRPRLWAKENGEVEVRGGARISAITDFPPDEEPEASAAPDSPATFPDEVPQPDPEKPSTPSVPPLPPGGA